MYELHYTFSVGHDPFIELCSNVRGMRETPEPLDLTAGGIRFEVAHSRGVAPVVSAVQTAVERT